MASLLEQVKDVCKLAESENASDIHKPLNIMNSRDDIEKEYQIFSELLASSKKKVSSLSTHNPSFVTLQNEYKKQLSDQIAKVEESLLDVQKYAIWDKLVIAFIGVTNAGKSTIIETFRILFDEKERKEALRLNPSGVDGLIIGDGRADFTRAYKEYNMSIGNKDFILIDVPGIEGEEKAVRDEILKALGKAHCVFYVQGEGKKPDAATIVKIKGYLRDWVKVYSIYNVRGTAFNYDEVEEREKLKTKDIEKIEKEIQTAMKDALGSNYAGNMTIQARLALCSYAKFAKNQKELIDEQVELMRGFGDAKTMFEFSNFSEITKCVDFLSSHFTDEIFAAQRRKLYKLHIEAYKELCETNELHITELSRITKRFQDCKSNVNKFFNTSLNSIHSQLREEINDMFDVLEEDGCNCIDSGLDGNRLESRINQDQVRLSNIVEDNAKIIIKNEVNNLRKNVNDEILRLKESFSITEVKGDMAINFNINLGNVISELEFGFGDLCNWGMYLGGIFMLFLSTNPIGWFLTAIYGFVSILGDSKEDKAKAKLREKISEAKTEFFRTEWLKTINKIDSEFNSKKGSFDKQFKKIIDDFTSLKKQMNDVTIEIKNNSLKYKSR